MSEPKKFTLLKLKSIIEQALERDEDNAEDIVVRFFVEKSREELNKPDVLHNELMPVTISQSHLIPEFEIFLRKKIDGPLKS